MSFWTKPVRELTYAEIVAFCQQGEHENETLEYRGVQTDVNEPRLYRTAAAMSNWWGGRILLGVDAKDGVPTLPIKGFKRKPNLEESIYQACRARENVYPPLVTMEVGVIDISASEHPEGRSGRVLVAVDVHESPHVPHRTDRDTRLYVRGQGLNDARDRDDEYTRFADSRDEHWLLSKRVAALGTREAHISTLSGLVPGRVARWIPKELDDVCCPRGCVWAIPAFPTQPIAKRGELMSLADRSQLYVAQWPPNLFGLAPGASSVEYVGFRRQSRGVIREVLGTKDTGQKQYFALGVNLVGMVFTAWSLQPDARGREGDTAWFETTLAEEMTALLLIYALRVYRRAGYRGLVQVGFRVDEARGLRPQIGRVCESNDKHVCLERAFVAEHEDLVERLYENRLEVLQGLNLEWQWAFDWVDPKWRAGFESEVMAKLPWDDLDRDFPASG